MERSTLITAMGNQVIDDNEVRAFNQALVRADCTTVKRVAMFCAQIGHESVGMRYYSEIWGPSSQQLTYQGRMGNNSPGDGYRYRGSGPLQITGKDNFRSLSKWAHARGYVPTATYFVDNPDKLRSIEYGFTGAVWYWTTARDMNSYADRGDIKGATLAVNGGYYGLDDRTSRYNKCLALGDALLPTDTEEITVAAKDDIIGFIKTYVGPIISDVKDIRQQLTGGRDAGDYSGWPQLGQNDKGENLTVVDSLADTRRRVIELEKRLNGGDQ